jgi:spore germination cell wall hydrolase CwlJ-like protein
MAIILTEKRKATMRTSTMFFKSLSIFLILVYAFSAYQINAKANIETNAREYSSDVYSTIYDLKEKITYQEFIQKKDQIKCLADNIYYEAGNESKKGKLAVATVTMNRVESNRFASTVCGVVYQKKGGTCQFSWTCNKYKPAPDRDVYRETYQIAMRSIIEDKRLESFPKTVLFYHADYVNPHWNFKRYAQIGAHIFYVART